MSNAELKITEAAGLSNQDWQARKEDAVARGQGNIAPVYIERALGSELWDVEGNEVIDFAAGIAVVNGSGEIHIRRAAGKLRDLEKVLEADPLTGRYGIGQRRRIGS